MRTSSFSRSFFQQKQTNNTQAPSSDAAGPSTSTAGPSSSSSAPREPMPKERKNHSLWIQSQITANFFKQKDFGTLKKQYTEMLDNISDFVHNELIDKLKETKLENETKKNNEAKVKKVEGYFGVLQKHLFADEGKYFVNGQDADDRPFMYGTVKEMFHDFLHLLKDESILPQPRVDVVVAIASKEGVNPKELASDLRNAIDKLTFIQQYTEVLDNIVAFVRNQGDKLNPPLLESTKNAVKGHFHVLKEHLFVEDGKYFVNSREEDFRPLMYENVKDMFHELAQVLKDEDISLQRRINAVVDFAPRAEVCSGGLGSDLQEMTMKLKIRGLMDSAYKWKIDIMKGVIHEHVKNRYRYTSGEEIHYVNAYYNLMASDMGVEKRVDPYVDNLRRNNVISVGALNSCKQNVLKMLKPMNLVNELADQYRSRLETAINENGIDPNNVSADESKRLKTIQEAELDFEYGEVSSHVFLREKDPESYLPPYVYTGKEWPTGLVLHFLKSLKKEELVDYNDSKIVLGDTGEGRIKMRDNLLWVKEKHVPPQRVTAQSWSKINPQELFDKIKETEPKNVLSRAAMLASIVGHVRSLPQAEEAKNVLGAWLLYATNNAQLGTLNALLKAGVDKEFKDNEGRTALMHAAANGQVGMLKALLKAGVSLEARDNQGRTALMHGAANGQVGTLKALLKAGAKKSAQDNEGKTAKMHAAEQAARQGGNSDAPALRVLKEAGRARVLKSFSKTQKRNAAQEDSLTAMLSAERVDLDELKALIDKGADIHAKNKNGDSAVTLAVRYGHADVLQVLIKNGADIEATHQGLAPLMHAVENGHADALRILIESGADIEAMHESSFLRTSINKVATNALMLATKKAHVDCMRILLEGGASTEVRDEDGITPLMFAAMAKDAHVRMRTTAMLGVLIENGANIDSQHNNTGFTPLIYAILYENTNAVQFLLENGADINIRNRNGNTAQEIAEVLPGSEMDAIRELLHDHVITERELMRNLHN